MTLKSSPNCPLSVNWDSKLRNENILKNNFSWHLDLAQNQESLENVLIAHTVKFDPVTV